MSLSPIEKNIANLPELVCVLISWYEQVLRTGHSLLPCLDYNFATAKNIEVLTSKHIEDIETFVEAYNGKTIDGRKMKVQFVKENSPVVVIGLDMTNEEKLKMLEEITRGNAATEIIEFIENIYCENPFIITFDIEGDEGIKKKLRDIAEIIMEAMPEIEMFEDGKSSGMLLAYVMEIVFDSKVTAST